MDEPISNLNEIKDKTVEDEVLEREARHRLMDEQREKEAEKLREILSRKDSNKRTTDLLREVIKKAAEQRVWPTLNEGLYNDLWYNWGIIELVNMIRESSEEQLRKLISIANSLGQETRMLVVSLISPYSYYTDSFKRDFPQICVRDTEESKEVYFQVLKEIAEDQRKVKSHLLDNEGFKDLASFVKKGQTKESFKEKLFKEIPWQTLETFLPSMCQEAYELTENYEELEVSKIKAHVLRIASDCEVVINNLKKPLEMIKKEEERALTKDEFKQKINEIKGLTMDDSVLEQLQQLERQLNKLF